MHCILKGERGLLREEGVAGARSGFAQDGVENREAHTRLTLNSRKLSVRKNPVSHVTAVLTPSRCTNNCHLTKTFAHGDKGRI